MIVLEVFWSTGSIPSAFWAPQRLDWDCDKGGIMLHAWEGTSSTFPTSPNKPLEHFHTELNTNYSK